MFATLAWLVACDVFGTLVDDTGTSAIVEDSGGGTEVGETGDSSVEDTEDTEDTEGPEPVDWFFDDVFGVPNIDDDNNNRSSDFSDNGGASGVNGEDDHATFTISKDIVDGLPDGESIRITLTGQTNKVRIYHSGSQVLGQNSDSTYEISPNGRVELTLEFAEMLSQGTLELERVNSAGVTQDSAEVLWMASPLLINHHLQEAEEVWAVAVSYFGSDNNAMMSDFESELGTGFTAANGQQYGNDVWIQDEFEWGNLYGTDTRIGVVLNLIRDRGIDDYAEDHMVEPGRISLIYGSGRASMQDYGGNLETTPPISVGGTDYPLGRFYYGDDGNMLSPHDDLVQAVEDNLLQEAFTQTIKWLCVGHVDEYHTFVPDKASAKGFKLVVADVDEAYALLESMNRNTNLPQYQVKGYRSVGEILDDNALRALNEDLRDDYIEPNISTFKSEMGLTEADIIRIPGLFEEVRGCGKTTAAFMPGTVNLAVANFEGEAVKLIAPDPFLRSNVNNQTGDALIDAWNSAMPASVETHFVDDWDIYHMALGEVHCGTKVQRAPGDDWWDTSLDILEGN